LNTAALQRHVLIPGGAGYVGTALTRELLDAGYRVTAFDALLYGHGFAVQQFLNHPRYRFVRGDIRDESAIAAVLDGVDHVVLLAGLVGDPICKKYPDLARQTNLEASMRLFDMAMGRNIDRFVFASTCSNYGLRETDDLATEESELNPVSLYAETKVAFEKHILNNANRADFSATVLRFATAYGFSQRMRFDLTVSEFIRELAMGNELLVYDEHTWRPYCHVVDISRAIRTVLEADETDVRAEVFNVGSPDENYTKKMIVEIALASGVSGTVRYNEGGVDPRNYRVSVEKFRKRFNFSNSRNVRDEAPLLVGAVTSGLFDDVALRRNHYGNYSIDIG
jgi:nucleoside-diphosphate-sugar epimerase